MRQIVGKGFRFGMLLQLAVGPVCLAVFKASATYGFFPPLATAAAAALVDAAYILLSGWGISAILERESVKRIVSIAGALILMLFGANMIAGAFSVQLLPSVALFSGAQSSNLFLQGIILTASNPLTVLFWGGVFSTQVMENHYDKKQLFLFGLGCVLSTFISLTLISLLGAAVGQFLPVSAMRVLNIGVGGVIVFFGVRMLLKQKTPEPGGRS